MVKFHEPRMLDDYTTHLVFATITRACPARVHPHNALQYGIDMQRNNDLLILQHITASKLLVSPQSARNDPASPLQCVDALSGRRLRQLSRKLTLACGASPPAAQVGSTQAFFALRSSRSPTCRFNELFNISKLQRAMFSTGSCIALITGAGGHFSTFTHMSTRGTSLSYKSMYCFKALLHPYTYN